jgi:hypothetical protein
MGSSITYYLQKGVTGACGTVHTDQDFIAAMGQYGSKFYLSAKLMTDK